MSPPLRPGFHVTAPAGWINDPLGVTWHETPDGGRYELFVQFNPEAPDWTPACRWGQLRAPDLVRWTWLGTALTPGPGEDGCWSGSVVVADDGRPVIVYTSVVEGSLDVGRIALAPGDPDWAHWTPDPGGPVLDGPPPGLAMPHFRDPYLWRADEGWRMVVAGGLPGGVAAALQYSSADLRDWRLDGVLAERLGAERDPVWSGSVWECAQFFPLGERWVLLVSGWHEGAGLGVVCAVGQYDGRRFTPRSWQRFAGTDALYATTTFLDAAGRRCALSWIREPAARPAPWAGALSVPYLLALDGDRVTAAPHPDVAALRTGVLARVSGCPAELGPFPPFLDVVLRAALPAGGRLDLALREDDGPALTVVLDRDDDAVLIERPGRAAERLPLGAGADGGAELRLLLDADLVEAVAGAGTPGALRRPAAGRPVRLAVSATGGAELRELTVHGMPAGRD